MSKYKAGDKVVLTVTGVDEMGCLTLYVINDNFKLWEQSIDDYTEPLSNYTEPLEAKISRQAAGITRLLAENNEPKEESKCNSSVNIEMARAEGQNESWELAREIILPPSQGGMSSDDYVAIFGSCISEAYIMKNYTYAEAAAKVAEWEKGKDEIKVGDIVKTKCDTSFEFCVTYIDCNGYLYGLGRYGGTYSDKNPEDWQKTGRHIDIDSFLKQIGGEQE